MSFQTRKTFVHLRNINQDILMKSESFLTLHKQRGTYHGQAQKHSKDIVKVGTRLNSNTKEKNKIIE